MNPGNILSSITSSIANLNANSAVQVAPKVPDGGNAFAEKWEKNYANATNKQVASSRNGFQVCNDTLKKHQDKAMAIAAKNPCFKPLVVAISQGDLAQRVAIEEDLNKITKFAKYAASQRHIYSDVLAQKAEKVHQKKKLKEGEQKFLELLELRNPKDGVEDVDDFIEHDEHIIENNAPAIAPAMPANDDEDDDELPGRKRQRKHD